MHTVGSCVSRQLRVFARALSLSLSVCVCGKTYLQHVELGTLNARPQPCDFGLDPGIHLLDLERMHRRLVPNPALFEVQIEPHPGRRSSNLLPQPLLQLFHIRHQSFIFALHECKVVPLQQLQLRLEPCEVYLLRIVGLVALLARHEAFGEVGDGLVDHVAQRFCENIGLLARDAGCFETLCECLCVKVVRGVERGGGGEAFREGWDWGRRRGGRR